MAQTLPNGFFGILHGRKVNFVIFAINFKFGYFFNILALFCYIRKEPFFSLQFLPSFKNRIL